jgi:hypothetical protein
MSDTTLRRSIIFGGVAALAVSALLIGRATWVSANATTAGPQAASNVAVDCEPSQQALVRHTVVNGEPRVAIQCVNSAQYARVARAVDQETLAPLPVAYTGRSAQAVPAVYQMETLEPARVVRRPATVRRASVQELEPKRSWQKRALVIGGTSGAGAGIGALIGGKKGALIGAAIGGGGGAIYEATRK